MFSDCYYIKHQFVNVTMQIARLKRDADGQSTNVSQRHVEDALLVWNLFC